MTYRHATEDEDFSDLSAGRVLYSQPGAPAFPVRLASEIFQRARALIAPQEPLTLYDPTCGGAYHLAALGFLHGETIKAILASDADPRILPLAGRNLSLLREDGLSRREQEIHAMLAEYGKESHQLALQSANRLRAMRAGMPEIATRVFQANVFDCRAVAQQLASARVDLVLSDVPYGRMTGWRGIDDAPPAAPLWQMLDCLRESLRPGAIVAIAADKSQKIIHEGYRRAARFQVGKRQVSLLQMPP